MIMDQIKQLLQALKCYTSEQIDTFLAGFNLDHFKRDTKQNQAEDKAYCCLSDYTPNMCPLFVSTTGLSEIHQACEKCRHITLRTGRLCCEYWNIGFTEFYKRVIEIL
jgi:hypothetical protein